MKSKLFLVMLAFAGISLATNAQSLKGEIRGKITDHYTKKPLDFVSVSLLSSNTVIVSQVLSDEQGAYIIKTLNPGKYEIRCCLLGFKNVIVKNVMVLSDEITFTDVTMQKGDSALKLQEVVITARRPLIDPDGVNKNTKTTKEIMALPQRNVNSIANTVSGVDARSGSTPNFRGARADGTAYYIDGVRAQGNSNSNTPQSTVSAPALVPNDETYTRFSENQFRSTKQDPLSTFSIDVDRASYAIVRSYLNSNILPPADAVRIEEMINYFPYEVSTSDKTHPFSIKTEVSESPWNKDHKLVHITLKAPKMEMKEAPPSNLVFLIDVSGSMQSPDKLYLLKDCLKLLVEALNPKDKISMVVYAGREGLVLDATSGRNKADIIDALEKLSAGGATAGGAGIKLAYKIAEKNFIKEGNNRVILATDGDFNVGISSPEALTALIEEKRESGVFLSVLGFGSGNLKDENMEKLADKGNGNYNYIDNILEGKKVLVKEVGGTLFTVAKDVKIQVEFNPKYVQSYKLIGYENRLLNNEDFNDDKKDAGEIGAGHCVTAIYELVLNQSDTAKPKVDDLKYQQQVLTDAAIGTELMNIKVRYKKPDGMISTRFEIPVYNNQQTFKEVSEDMRFAVSVAVFGMKLRNSPFVKDIKFDSIIDMCKASKGKDEDGYRAEFIKMVETAELLASR
jgi:Ca-activated chloride channel family protein